MKKSRKERSDKRIKRGLNKEKRPVGRPRKIREEAEGAKECQGIYKREYIYIYIYKNDKQRPKMKNRSR